MSVRFNSSSGNCPTGQNDETSKRCDAYRRDTSIESQLQFVNHLLTGINTAGQGMSNAPEHGPVFVTGLQRCGTTLLMQLLCSSFCFTYPDNVVARFWEKPFVGVAVSKSLREQLGGGDKGLSFSSDYGVTQEVFDPHEFGFFWTKYFGFDPVHELDKEQLHRVDIKGLKADLGQMEYVGGAPLLFKIVPLSLNLDYVANAFPSAKFIIGDRDPLYVAQSTYVGRINRYGSAETWWSLKPRDYEELKKLDPMQQVVRQVKSCRSRLSHCLQRIPEDRKFILNYTELCAAPKEMLTRIRIFLKQPFTGSLQSVPNEFENRNERKIDKEVFEKIRCEFDESDRQQLV